MKKIVLLAAMALVGMSANAQKVEKASAGTFGLEIQMNPFDQNGKTFSLDGLKARYFITDKDAVRAKLGFDFAKNKAKADADKDPFTSSMTGSLNFSVGYERHFDLAPRLSAYVGGSIGLERNFAKAKSFKDDDNYTEYKNMAGQNNRGSFGFNLAAITGLDFYVYKGLYIGAELGLGVESTKASKTTVKTVTGGTEVKNESNDSQRATTAGINVQPQLRLGWNF